MPWAMAINLDAEAFHLGQELGLGLGIGLEGRVQVEGDLELRRRALEARGGLAEAWALQSAEASQFALHDGGSALPSHPPEQEPSRSPRT